MLYIKAQSMFTARNKHSLCSLLEKNTAYVHCEKNKHSLCSLREKKHSLCSLREK